MISKEFVLAGRAIFTVKSTTGQYYTYRVIKKEAKNGYKESIFVSVLTGPDNTTDYTYLGLLDSTTAKVILTKASKYNKETQLYRVCNWALHHIWNNKALPDGYAIYHEGRCGRCGRTLTTPTSVETGLGPECSKMVG